MASLCPISTDMKILCYVGALVAFLLSAVPLFLFWRQAQSGRADYQQYAYFDYNGILAVGILLVGILVAAELLSRSGFSRTESQSSPSHAPSFSVRRMNGKLGR